MKNKPEIVRLYREDYVVVLKIDDSFLSFSNGEVIIYSTWEEANYDARTMNGLVYSCRGLPDGKQAKLLRNIVKHLSI